MMVYKARAFSMYGPVNQPTNGGATWRAMGKVNKGNGSVAVLNTHGLFSCPIQLLVSRIVGWSGTINQQDQYSRDMRTTTVAFRIDSTWLHQGGQKQSQGNISKKNSTHNQSKEDLKLNEKYGSIFGYHANIQSNKGEKT